MLVPAVTSCEAVKSPLLLVTLIAPLLVVIPLILLTVPMVNKAALLELFVKVNALPLPDKLAAIVPTALF